MAAKKIYFSSSSKGLWDASITSHNKAAVTGWSVSQSWHQALCLSTISGGSYRRQWFQPLIPTHATNILNIQWWMQ